MYRLVQLLFFLIQLYRLSKLYRITIYKIFTISMKQQLLACLQCNYTTLVLQNLLKHPIYYLGMVVPDGS